VSLDKPVSRSTAVMFMTNPVGKNI